MNELTDVELDHALDVALRLAQGAAVTMRETFPNAGQITEKANSADLVTVVDLAVEEWVRAELARVFPRHQVRGEEFSNSPHSDRELVWYVDPVDGTMNYVHRLPWSCFSLALADRSGPLVGVVADPWRNEVFSAVRGRGARLSGAEIHCSGATKLSAGVLLTELAGVHPWPGMFEMLGSLAVGGCGSRVLGSSALSLAYVGAGRCVGTVLGDYHSWDVMAGVLIARESGALILSRSGQEEALPRGGLLAVAPGVAQATWQAWTGLDVSLMERRQDNERTSWGNRRLNPGVVPE